MSEAFYRRWRPQTLGEIIGQQHVTQTLINALKTGHVSHAYLFCGPRGTGKTSTSRILAKAVNCLSSGGTDEPCNHCSMCMAITDGSAMDVIEIDAASNTGVDDIRALKEKVAYSPGQARYKVYVIDEVHMLSTSASNALLKTLEEPPPRVIFILATTEPHKIIPTILSRCQRFDFRRLSYTDINQKLKGICRDEGLEIGDEALNLIARSSTGSLRDAENLLEQLSTYYGNSITSSQVQALLGNTGSQYVAELLGCITGNNVAAGLKLINRAVSAGVDLKLFAREITDRLRGILLLKSGCNELANFTGEEIESLRELAGQIENERLIKTTRLFGELKIENYSPLALELALIDSTLQPKEKPNGHKQATRTKKEQAEQSAGDTPGETPAGKIDPGADSEPDNVLPDNQTPQAEPETALQACSEFDLLKRNWNQMLEEAPDSTKRSVAIALLRSSVRLVSFEDDELTLAFKFKIHQEKMEQSANKKVSSQIVSSFIGRPINIKCVHEPEKNHLVRMAQEQVGARIVQVEEK